MGEELTEQNYYKWRDKEEETAKGHELRIIIIFNV